MVDLTDQQLAEVKEIIQTKLDQTAEIYVFGSRAKGKARKYSDLDLLLKTPEKISYQQLALLEEEFSESDLPFKTDLVDWHRIDEEFRQHIAPQLIKIQ